MPSRWPPDEATGKFSLPKHLGYRESIFRDPFYMPMTIRRHVASHVGPSCVCRWSVKYFPLLGTPNAEDSCSQSSITHVLKDFE